MSKANNQYDSVAVRLAAIMQRLNDGQTLKPAQLAEEFRVDIRTIQRDLNDRLSFLPLERKEKQYVLNTAYLGKLTLTDLRRFAELAGVRGLFPTFTDSFLRELFDYRMQDALLIKSPHYEDLRSLQPQFQQLEQAIVNHHLISFSYRKDGGTKTYNLAKPYKLVHHGGIWYLAAQDGSTLKSFTFSKIEGLTTHPDTFKPEPELNRTLQEEDGVWLNPDKKEVVLKVDREVASYFSRRNLIAHQVIEKTLEDGGLLISGRVAHPNQILPTVRYWIPHVRIISPEGLQAEMEAQIRGYLAPP